MIKTFIAILSRDVRLAWRHGTDSVAALLFFILCGCLFPLALGPSPDLLHRVAPGIIWVCALLAAMLPLERLFSADFEDGSLDSLRLTGLPAPYIGLGKILSHWLTTGLPLLIAAGPMGLMLGVTVADLPALLMGLALGTPLLSLIGGMAAAITIGARRGGLLLPLIILPLASPVLIFGASAVNRAQYHLPPGPELDVLGAFLLVALPACAFATGAALRAASQN